MKFPDHLIDRLPSIDPSQNARRVAIVEAVAKSLRNGDLRPAWRLDDEEPFDVKIGAFWDRKTECDEAGNISPEVGHTAYRSADGSQDRYVVVNITVAIDPHGMPDHIAEMVANERHAAKVDAGLALDEDIRAVEQQKRALEEQIAVLEGRKEQLAAERENLPK